MSFLITKKNVTETLTYIVSANQRRMDEILSSMLKGIGGIKDSSVIGFPNRLYDCYERSDTQIQGIILLFTDLKPVWPFRQECEKARKELKEYYESCSEKLLNEAFQSRQMNEAA